LNGKAWTTTDGCQRCILGGFEFVAAKKEEYVGKAVTDAIVGECCVPTLYDDNTCTGITKYDTAVRKSSIDWK
jgi:hypothetical protein